MQQNDGQKITEYYNKYKYRQIAFNKQIIKQIGLIVKRVSFKCKMKDFPCILYSASMQSASILASLIFGDFDLIDKNNKKISLKLSFMSMTEKKVISFFIDCKVIGSTIYKGNIKNLYMIALDYINMCPRDLILAIGNYLEKETNMEKRIYQRVVVTHQYKQGKDIQPSKSYLFISGKSRNCILSEISIFSAKVIIFGKSEEFIDKNTILIIKTIGINELGELIGVIKRCEAVDPDKGLLSLIIVFDQERIPPNYKMWVGEYIEHIALKYRK